MAKGQYIGISGVARQVKKQYIGVNNIARRIKMGYIGVNNVARKFYAGGVPASTLTVGSSVYMNVGGQPTEFIIVHNGLPSSSYDSSCNGIWLLMKDIYTKKAWRDSGVSDKGYAESTIRTYLNNSFFGLLDNDIQDIVKSVSIPYNYYSGSAYVSGKVACKVFLLSYSEVFSTSAFQENKGDNGSILDFFKGDSASNRIAYYNGTATNWWLRTISTPSGTTRNPYAEAQGSSAINPPTTNNGIRPALIIPNDTLIDSDYNIIA